MANVHTDIGGWSGATKFVGGCEELEWIELAELHGEREWHS